MRKYILIICIGVFGGIWCGPGFGATARELFTLANRNAADGKRDFAFMNFRALLRDFPHSRQAESALFAMGEYYYFLPDLDQAVMSFESYLKKYPDSDNRLFALAYLLRIARFRGKKERTAMLEKEIIGRKQLGLVFSDYKQCFMRTPLRQDFQAVFQIDKITFYLNGELFEKILY